MNSMKYIENNETKTRKSHKRNKMKTMKERFKKAAKRIPKDDDTEIRKLSERDGSQVNGKNNILVRHV